MLGIHFGIVGFGFIGKKHADLIVKHPFSHLFAIADDDDQKKHEADSFFVPFYNSLETLLKESKPDIVNICTPNGLHEEQTRLALEAGCHVICEKPIGLNYKKGVELLELAKKQQKNLYCMLQNRYSPPSIWLKNLINSNVLGEIYYIQINCFWNRDKRYYTSGSWRGSLELDGGPLYTQFSHFIDILFWIFGSYESIDFANLWNFNHQNLTQFEDSGTITFTLKGNIKVNFQYSTSVWQQNLESSITVLAEKGSIKIGGQYMNEVLNCNIENYEMPDIQASDPPNNYGAYVGSASNHGFIIHEMVDNVINDKLDYSNATQALESIRFIEEVYQKYR